MLSKGGMSNRRKLEMGLKVNILESFARAGE